MAKTRYKRRKRMTARTKFKGAKTLGLQGYLHTKEQLLMNYRITSNGDGSAIVNGFSTALLNQYPEATQFSDVTQHTQYAALYKQYRITGIRYQFFPIHTVSATQDIQAGTLNTPLPQFWWKYARNGQPNPTDTDEIIQMCPKVRQFSRPFSIYVRNPMALQQAWTSSGTTGTSVETTKSGAVWLSGDDYPSVDHYALQFGLLNASPGLQYGIKCVKTVYMSFKSPQ